MHKSNLFEVIIIGGSYAGLSAALAFGCSLRSVLLIDGSNPCNKTAPHSHNFITHDGDVPGDIARVAREQVLKCPTVQFENDFATATNIALQGFEVFTQSGKIYQGRKLLFASGIADTMPAIKGFAACWGISVLHCPYCHGYEVRNQHIALFGNGDAGFELARLLTNWSPNLHLFTNGRSTLTEAQTSLLQQHEIGITETEILSMEHVNGQVTNLHFLDGSHHKVDAVFARIPFRQHSHIPEVLGCAFTDHGFIKVNELQQTSVSGVYAAGDNSSMMRSISTAVSAGTMAGAAINKGLIEERFMEFQH